MPQHFGKFQVQRKLAEGGMAEVFLARQSGMDGFEKPVVIKRILPHLTGEAQFVEMFLNEAKIAARLSHPSIVQIFDFGRVDGQYYIAMEFIHGEDLRNLAKAAEKAKKRPSMALVARVVADMLGGLHYAHTRAGVDGRPLGLVHRDISPQNVLVTYEGGVKLVDFGIAKATQAHGAVQTQAGLLKGKYAYMSPEQCRGKSLDARSDVFAVGILLWELLTWKRLFRRDTDLATLVAVADEPIPAVSSVRGDVPPELDRICARALARPVAERYPSAQAMQADLEALIRKYGWEADTIKLQQYMRDVFGEKLRQQDDAIRAAGLGSIEDFLLRVDEGTRMSWMEGQVTEDRTPSGGMGLEPNDPAAAGHLLPPHPTPGNQRPTLMPGQLAAPVPIPAQPRSGAVPTQPMQAQPSRPIHIAPTPAPLQQPVPFPQAGPEFTGSTLSRAAIPIHPTGSQSIVAPPPPSGWKRLAVVLATSAVVGGVVLTAVLWEPSGSTGTAAATGDPVGVVQVEELAKIRVVLDKPATVIIDGEAHGPDKDVQVQVKARAAHEVRIEVDGELDGSVLKIPPLEPGEVRTVRRRLGN